MGLCARAHCVPCLGEPAIVHFVSLDSMLFSLLLMIVFVVIPCVFCADADKVDDSDEIFSIFGFSILVFLR